MKVNGERVAALREGLNLNREQLAVKAGISSRTLARIENEEGPINRSTLFVLAHALDCDAADLTGLEQAA